MQAFSIKLPKNVIRSLKAGLKKHRAGFSGDGLTAKTITSAQHGIKNGRWPKDKIVKASAWFARHNHNFEQAKNANTPMVTAWQLWGGGYGGREWLDAQAQKIKAKKNQVAKSAPRKTGVQKPMTNQNPKRRTWKGVAISRKKYPDGFKWEIIEREGADDTTEVIVRNGRLSFSAFTVYPSKTGGRDTYSEEIKYKYLKDAKRHFSSSKAQKNDGLKTLRANKARTNPRLSAKQRRELPDRAFGFITKSGERKYPLMYPNAKGKPEWSEARDRRNS